MSLKFLCLENRHAEFFGDTLPYKSRRHVLPTFSSCPTEDFSLEVAKVQECVFLHMNSKKFAV